MFNSTSSTIKNHTLTNLCFNKYIIRKMTSICLSDVVFAESIILALSPSNCSRVPFCLKSTFQSETNPTMLSREFYFESHKIFVFYYKTNSNKQTSEFLIYIFYLKTTDLNPNKIQPRGLKNKKVFLFVSLVLKFPMKPV